MDFALLFDKAILALVVGFYIYMQKKFLDRLDVNTKAVTVLRADFDAHEEYVHGMSTKKEEA